jgi:hypothetical protein
MINEQMKQYVEKLVEGNALVFETKEGYLKWRTSWKEKYNYMTLLIRKLKNARKKVHFNEKLRLTEEDEKFIVDNITKYSWDRIDAARSRVRRMLCELIAAREIHKKKQALEV